MQMSEVREVLTKVLEFFPKCCVCQLAATRMSSLGCEDCDDNALYCDSCNVPLHKAVKNTWQTLRYTDTVQRIKRLLTQNNL